MGLVNKRPFRRFVLVNIIDKAIGQSRFYRGDILRRFNRAGYRQKVDIGVGNLHLFRGYRSLHCNMPCESGALRATPPRIERSVVSRRTERAVAAQGEKRACSTTEGPSALTSGIEPVEAQALQGHGTSQQRLICHRVARRR